MYRSISRSSVVAVVLAAIVVVAGAGAASAGAAGAAPSRAGSAAACRVLSPDLFVREGPGMAFPAVAKFIQGTVLQGIGFVKTGVPDGSWVQVQQEPGNPIGYVTADPRQLGCSVPPNTLPAQKAPPAPPDEDEPVGRTRINGDGLNLTGIRGPADYNDGVYMVLPGLDQKWVETVVKANSGQIRFGDGVGFGIDVLDRRTGRRPGDGIKQVEIKITDGNGNVAYDTIEHSAPYCIFSDENGQCNVLRFSKMGYKWPDTAIARGALRPFDDTFYTAEITITPVQGQPILWLWSFNLAPIAVEFR